MSMPSKALREPRHIAAGRRLFAALTIAMVLLLSGCAAPPTGPAGSDAAGTTTARSDVAAQRIAATPAATPAGSPPTAPAPTPRRKPAPPMSDPLPAQRVPDTQSVPAGTAPKLNRSCKTSADCAVKDVGNCCGYYPRCVNVNAAVDPQAVQAQCARSGMASVCGFKPVESCECVQGECQDQSMMFEAQ